MKMARFSSIIIIFFFLFSTTPVNSGTSSGRCPPPSVEYGSDACLVIRPDEHSGDDLSQSFSHANKDCTEGTLGGLKWMLPQMDNEDSLKRFINALIQNKAYVQTDDPTYIWIGLQRDQEINQNQNQLQQDIHMKSGWSNPARWRWLYSNTSLEKTYLNFGTLFWRKTSKPPQPDNNANKFNADFQERCVLAKIFKNPLNHDDEILQLEWHDVLCELDPDTVRILTNHNNQLSLFNSSAIVEGNLNRHITWLACQAHSVERTKFWRTWWFYTILAILALIVIGLGVFGLIYKIVQRRRRRRRSQKRKGKRNGHRSRQRRSKSRKRGKKRNDEDENEDSGEFDYVVCKLAPIRADNDRSRGSMSSNGNGYDYSKRMKAKIEPSVPVPTKAKIGGPVGPKKSLGVPPKAKIGPSMPIKTVLPKASQVITKKDPTPKNGLIVSPDSVSVHDHEYDNVKK